MSLTLSICIPTYNRAPFLDEAIGSIASQVCDDMTGVLELCISDNASTDETGHIVERWRRCLKIPIHYSRNERNLGADANYLRCVEMAETEFCWFLGSDDRVEQGGVRKVLDLLALYRQVAIFVFSRHDYSYDFSHYIPQPKDSLYDKLRQAHVFKDTREALKNVVDAFGYLSILVFKKDLWDSVEGYEPFVGSAYVHVHKFLTMMKNGAQVMFVREAVVGWRSGNDSFSEELKTFGRIRIDVEGFDRIGTAVFGDFSPEHRDIVNRILQIQARRWVYHIKYSATTVALQWKVLLLYIRYYWRFCRFWGTIFPLLLVPGSLMSFAKKTFRSIIPKKALI